MGITMSLRTFAACSICLNWKGWIGLSDISFRQALEGVSPTMLNAVTGFAKPFSVSSPTAAVSISPRGGS